MRAQEQVVDMMWRMALARPLARLVGSCKLFFNFRLLSAFDEDENSDLCS